MILPVLGVTGVIIVGALLLTKQQQERNRGQSAEGSQPLA